jgi:hypothetical protein
MCKGDSERIKEVCPLEGERCFGNTFCEFIVARASCKAAVSGDSIPTASVTTFF